MIIYNTFINYDLEYVKEVVNKALEKRGVDVDCIDYSKYSLCGRVFIHLKDGSAYPKISNITDKSGKISSLQWRRLTINSYCMPTVDNCNENCLVLKQEKKHHNPQSL